MDILIDQTGMTVDDRERKQCHKCKQLIWVVAYGWYKDGSKDDVCCTCRRAERER